MYDKNKLSLIGQLIKLTYMSKILASKKIKMVCFICLVYSIYPKKVFRMQFTCF